MFGGGVLKSSWYPSERLSAISPFTQNGKHPSGILNKDPLSVYERFLTV